MLDHAGLGVQADFPATPDTDVPGDPRRLAHVNALGLDMVIADVVEIEAEEGGAADVCQQRAEATMARACIDLDPATPGCLVETGAIRVVSSSHASAATSGSSAEGSIIENVSIQLPGGEVQNLDTITEPTTLTLLDPVTRSTIRIAFLDAQRGGAKAGVVQPQPAGTSGPFELGSFESSLTMMGIHVSVTSDAGETVADLVAGFAQSDCSCGPVCDVRMPHVSGRGFALRSLGDETLIDGGSGLFDPTATLSENEVATVVLPSTGGVESSTAKTIGPLTDGASPPGATIAESETAHCQTSGTVDADANASAAQTRCAIENLSLLDTGAGPALSADAIDVSCNATADSEGASSTATMTLLKPSLSGVGDVCAPLSAILPGLDTCHPAPNTEIALGPLGVLVRLNEQVCDDGGSLPDCAGSTSTGITVNGIHVFVVGEGNPLGLPVGAELILSSAHCDAAVPESPR